MKELYDDIADGVKETVKNTYEMKEDWSTDFYLVLIVDSVSSNLLQVT